MCSLHFCNENKLNRISLQKQDVSIAKQKIINNLTSVVQTLQSSYPDSKFFCDTVTAAEAPFIMERGSEQKYSLMILLFLPQEKNTPVQKRS